MGGGRQTTHWHRVDTSPYDPHVQYLTQVQCSKPQRHLVAYPYSLAHHTRVVLYCIVTPGHSHHLRRTGPAYEKRTLPRPPHPTHPPHPSQPSPRLRPACTDRVSPPPSRCRRASRAEGARTRGLSVRRRRVRGTTVIPERSPPLERSPSSSLLSLLPPGAERMCVGSWRCGWRCGSPRSWRPSARASRGVGRTACGWP